MLRSRLERLTAVAVALTGFAMQANGQATTSSTTASVSTATTQSAPTSITSSSSSSLTLTSSAPSATPTHSNPSVFVSPTQDLVFGLTIPDDNNADIYFTIASSTSNTWAAIGLGYNQMPNSLMLMIYTSANGQNVTFSPRLSYGNREPVYWDGMQYEVLNGTGLFDDNNIMVFSARCSNCRNWPNGYIDHTKTAQPCIFAEGPEGWVGSDDPAAPLKYHEVYGAFTMNMVAATGPKGAPLVPVSVATFLGQNASTILGDYKANGRDWGAALHAFCMLGSWMVLIPFGVLILRGGGRVKWHGINQGLAAIGALIGAGLGVYVSFSYNRSRGFNNPHQIIGLIVSAGLIAQFTLGFIHHRIWNQTQKTTKLKPVHIWLGRILIALAISDAFLGFPFALNAGSNWFLAGCVVVLVGVLAASFWWQRRYPGRSFFARGRGAPQAGPFGAEPYRQGGAPPPPYGGAGNTDASNPFSDRHAAVPSAGYQAVGAEEEQGIISTPRHGGVELRDLSPRPDMERGDGGYTDVGGRRSPQPPGRRLAGGPSDSAADLGKQQTPAEYL